MRTFERVALLLLGPVMLLACASNPTPAPDAQYIHVLANDVAIQVDPATVRVGDNIYLVLEPPTDQVWFGDLQGTSLQGFEMTGCGGDALETDRGRLRVPGNCGNVFWLPDLEPGKYAFLLEDPTGLPEGAPIVMAVLEVTP